MCVTVGCLCVCVCVCVCVWVCVRDRVCVWVSVLYPWSQVGSLLSHPHWLSRSCPFRSSQGITLNIYMTSFEELDVLARKLFQRKIRPRESFWASASFRGKLCYGRTRNSLLSRQQLSEDAMKESKFKGREHRKGAKKNWWGELIYIYDFVVDPQGGSCSTVA